MAPLESALEAAPVWPQTVVSPMRALLYVSRQLGRPVSEAELRSLAVLPEGPLDSAAFLLAARRLDGRPDRAGRRADRCHGLCPRPHWPRRSAVRRWRGLSELNEIRILDPRQSLAGQSRA